MVYLVTKSAGLALEPSPPSTPPSPAALSILDILRSMAITFGYSLKISFVTAGLFAFLLYDYHAI